jgi:gliding motility associated protien GldN
VLGFESEPKTDENGNFIALTSIVDPESDSLDINGNPVYPPRDMVWITSRDIVAYQLKENWFFDKERSVLDVRIIGIAPVVYFSEKGKPVVTDQATGSLSDKIATQRPLFWLYYPQLRYIINNYFVYNDENDAQWMSFDDLFLKRRFNSTIIKESNNYDRNIESYRTGIDALMESEKIKDEIRNIEHDVWSF